MSIMGPDKEVRGPLGRIEDAMEEELSPSKGIPEEIPESQYEDLRRRIDRVGKETQKEIAARHEYIQEDVEKRSNILLNELRERDKALHYRIDAVNRLREKQANASSIPDALNPAKFPVRYAAAAGVILTFLWRYFFGADVPAELKDALLVFVPVVFAILGGKATVAKAKVKENPDEAIEEARK